MQTSALETKAILKAKSPLAGPALLSLPAPGNCASTVLCCALSVAAFLGYWLERPFSRVLTSKTMSLSGLSSQQKLNIENAARCLDGFVLKPNQEFSFNAVVGPRTSSRGYLAAPSYLGKEAPSTMGGGICLLSSAVYQNALRAGLQVTERVAHLRTIKSVPAGLDATVWYGMADLRFRNTLDCPIELVTRYSPYQITVELRGNTHIEGWQPARITRCERLISPGRLQACVFSKHLGEARMVSRDVYGIPTTGERRR